MCTAAVIHRSRAKQVDVASKSELGSGGATLAETTSARLQPLQEEHRPIFFKVNFLFLQQTPALQGHLPVQKATQKARFSQTLQAVLSPCFSRRIVGSEPSKHRHVSLRLCQQYASLPIPLRYLIELTTNSDS
jgi:hypothetical protein